jgi:hypothetical protein
MVRIRAQPNARQSDPLIDEVRANRRQLVQEFDNDLDRLVDHLRKVQADYENRTGQFANLPRHIPDEPFPTMSRAIADPTHEEVRALHIAVPRKSPPRRRRRA